MKLVKDSIIDSCKFALITRKFSDLGKARIRDASIKASEDKCVLTSNAWKSFLSFMKSFDDQEAQTTMSTKSYAAGNWNDYVALTRSLETRAEVHSSSPDDTKSPPLRMILDKNEVKTFSEQSGRDIGIMYDSPCNTLVVDLVKDADGNEFAYERLIPKNDGAVVMIPSYKRRFILLNQYRHAIGGRQLCFPRGFGENGLDAKENAMKELREEIGATRLLSIQRLGELTPDSGISANRVSVFFREIEGYDSEKRDEGITEIREYSLEELLDMIKSSQITDGFTLAALTMYQATPKE